ncbi:MAG: hypothetical protein JWP89_1605 [Schlesneria sp.]|nr:hypothetical protein [Schlesneria sp.]
MGESLKRLSFGFFLIALASAVLLLSEAPRQKPRETSLATSESTIPTRTMRVAMFQMASQPIIDEGAQGVIDSLKEAGFVDGKNLKLTRFNAEGDIATGNAISQELAAGDYDLVITLTTGALQSFANVNKQRKVPHVFGLVSDPVKAGVGVGTEPMDHPAHLTGIGTFPPVDQALELARRINPKLSKVGIGWNPAEINSEVSTKLAREVCKKLKIELLEANVENTSTVKEAVRSLIDRQAEALLVGGDVTMLGAIDVVAKTGSDAHIPTFTCMPGNAKKGTLFDVGANYYEVGRTVGRVAARVLKGESIASIPVEIAIPPKLFVNKLALKSLNGEWAFPDDVVKSADSIIDESGQTDKVTVVVAAPPTQNQPLVNLWQLRIVSYVNSDDVAEAERGLREGLKKSGLVEGRDYAVKMLNAQGDMATLNSLVDAAIADNTDLLLTISTQALQSCVQKAQGLPIVFTMVANPFAAGVGKSESDHLSNVTGAYGANDVKRMMPIIRQLMPDAKKLGTLFVPGEVNSVYSYELLVEAARGAGYELVSVGVNAGTEVLDGTQSLCDQHLDAICLSNSNLTGAAFPSVAQAASKAKLPVFAFLGSASKQGAAVVLTRDYYDMGLDSAQIAARVMRGEKPAAIPFFQSTKSKLYLNLASAQKLGLTIPESLIKAADQVIDK